MFCKYCGTQIGDTAVRCPQCGAATGVAPMREDNTIFCSNCGQAISKKALICPHCGVGTELYRIDQMKSRKATAASTPPAINIVNTNTNANYGTMFGYPLKRKWVAFFLCLFFGYFGIHRFYVGKGVTGALYLFTLGICGIGWCFDLLLILLGGFRDKWGQPLV